MDREISGAISYFASILESRNKNLEEKYIETQRELSNYKTEKGEIGEVVYSYTYMDLSKYIRDLEYNILEAIRN